VRLINSHWAEASVVAIAVLLWVPRLSGPIDLRWDAGVYYVLGTSVATGHGYRMLSEPGSPEAVQYPPLLPAVVALCQRALGSTEPAIVAPWLRKMNLIIFVLYAFVALRLARRYLRVGFAVVAVALCLLQFMTIFISDLLSADLPFALLTVMFVIIATGSPPLVHPWVREIASFLLAAAGFFLRTAGIALFVAWVIEALARRHWRLAVTRSVLAMLPLIAWGAYVTRVRGTYEYAHPAYEFQRASYQFYNVSYAENVGLISDGHVHLRSITAHVGENVGPMLKSLGEAVSTSEDYWRQFLADMQQLWMGRRGTHPVLVLIPVIVFSVLVITGLIILAIRRAWLMLAIPVISIGLICTTPWPDQFQRYLMPLAPFLAIAALLALSQLRAALRGSQRLRPFTVVVGQVALAGLVVLALTLQAYTACQLFYQRLRSGTNFAYGGRIVREHYFYYGRRWQAWVAAAAWINANTPPDTIVATPQRHFCYLRTNRLAVLPPMETDPKRARRLLEAVPVSYVVIDEIGEMASFGRRYALPAVQGDSIGWPLVYSVGGAQIYERAVGRK
jgi:hypothetical protein